MHEEVQNKPQLLNQNLLLKDNGVNIPYRKVTEGTALYVIKVNDIANETDIQQDLHQKLLKDYWFLDPDIQKEELKQRFGIILDENVEVDVYNFQQEFGQEQLTQMASTLAKYYHALKDKKIWNLESIQIRSLNEVNGKNGQPFRGKEFPKQNRFELFPASFEEGKYRDTLNCKEIEGATVHETTHVVLEGLLSQLWWQHYEKLGWKTLENQLLILPGGSTTVYFNKDYKDLPTDYASYQPNDDRAESVVAFLFDQSHLNAPRQEVLNEIFNTPNNDTNSMFQITEKPAVLPELPEITVLVKKPEPTGFKMGKTTFNQNPNSPIPLVEYRRRNT